MNLYSVKINPVKKILGIHILLAVLVFAQINFPPKIKEVLNKTENIFKGKKIEAKYIFSTTIGKYLDSDSKQKNYEIIEIESNLMADLNSGKFYLENGDRQISVYDGNYLWNYDKVINAYNKIPLKNTPSHFVFPLFIIDLAKAIPKIESVDMEEVSFENKNCFLIKFSGKDFANNSCTVNLWINKENYYPVQFQSLTTIGTELSEMNYKFKSLKINPEISDDKFNFKIPEGAKEIKTGK
ncbi:MAG TPA: DUF2092 domain-containing protein [bacterium]|nr:DUF2092 domain-containing protein [bacterium]HOM27557.1 DUF2092 domain-containing protein [bacterium]